MIKIQHLIISKNNRENSSSTRSRLFNIEPIGIGTSSVESLRSYIGRLAIGHTVRVGDLLKYEIVEKLGITEYEFYSNRSQINKFGPFTENLVSVLEELTKRTDLGYLTLRKWKNAFPNRNGIFHQHLKWCTKCLMELRDNNQDIYEPLIWTIYCINMCPKHKIELSSVCPHCCKSPKSFSPRYRPGYCPHCEKWLGEEIPFKEIVGIELERQLMLSNAVGELLSHNNVQSKTIEKEDITVSIIRIMEKATKGNNKEFAELINKSRDLIWLWKNGKRYPEFESLIDICEATNIKVVDFLLNRIEYSSVENKKIPHKKILRKKSAVERDYVQIEKQLECSFLNEYPPPSLAELKKRLNYNKIREKFPLLSGMSTLN
ncbi:TniQ family protein [uncultured Metabacillus sp.]|uniref:TniQ family protein n=1 Tax=uncultured Metabacillus sp. TaxID=2860135 RepID=UPI002632160A|nr:TniQ family protein [uncultured Metabacillus sp.]